MCKTRFGSQVMILNSFKKIGKNWKNYHHRQFPKKLIEKINAEFILFTLSSRDLDHINSMKWRCLYSKYLMICKTCFQKPWRKHQLCLLPCFNPNPHFSYTDKSAIFYKDRNEFQFCFSNWAEKPSFWGWACLWRVTEGSKQNVARYRRPAVMSLHHLHCLASSHHSLSL